MASDQPVLSVTDAEWTAFRVARAEAISKYCGLEQHLCACFAYFSGTGPNVAGTIFFKISNARARRDILDDLKRQKIGVKYTGFWDSLMKRVAPLDDERNLVVHWTVALSIFINTDRALRIARPMLKKPNFHGWTADCPELYQVDLENFTRRCEIVSGALAGLMFALGAEPQYIGVTGTLETWREICQRPLDDPLPPDHPLFQTPTAP